MVLQRVSQVLVSRFSTLFPCSIIGICGFVFVHDEIKVMLESSLIKLEFKSGPRFVLLYTPYISTGLFIFLKGRARSNTIKGCTADEQIAMSKSLNLYQTKIHPLLSKGLL